jgi:hypothetical protein
MTTKYDSNEDVIAAFRASKEANFMLFLKQLDKEAEVAYNKLESETED